MGWIFEGPFHQSHLRDANLCMKMFELKHRYGAPPESRGLPLVNGTAIHRAIERVHNEDLFHFSELDLGAVYRESFAEAIDREPDIPIRWDTDKKTDLAKLSADAGQILKNYCSRAHNRQCDVLLSEATFSVDIGGYPFVGTIDQVRKQHGGIVLIDFKSGKTKPMDHVLRIGLQFSVYTHGLLSGEFENGVNGMPRALPDQVVHYQLNDHLTYKKNGKWGKAGEERGPAWYPTERTEHDLEASTEEIKRICGNIRRGTFPRTAQDMVCRMCAVKDACLEDYKHGGLNNNLVRKLKITLNEEE